MRAVSLRVVAPTWKSVFFGSIVSLAAVSAQAQTIFCPSTIPGVNTGTGFALAAGLCTNGNTGAVSAAALSSQALGDIQQSVTQQTTTATLDAISARRKEETERCPEGFERSNDPERTCRRIAVAEPAPRVSSAPSRPSSSRPAPRPVAMPVKAPPVIAVDPGYRFGVWAHAFGDYERRTDSAANALGVTIAGGVIQTPGGVVTTGPNTVVQPIAVDLTQKATTWGVIGGGDVTFRNLLAGNDGLIVGILAGYVSTDISLNATTRPTTPPPAGIPAIATGTSSGKIRVSGPSVGGYYTYFNGPFSTDTTLKADFLSINESFTELLAFNAGFGTGLITGAGSANVTNFVAASNYQYRFPISAALWVEPTVGYRYTNSRYDSGAAALGLQDGYDWRVQGGARLGIESFWNNIYVTTTITGLAYSDVKIVGGPITSGAGGSFAGTTIPSDQGKVRGEGIFLTNFDYGRGFSTFVQGEVRGGSGLFGAGGRIGARLQL